MFPYRCPHSVPNSGSFIRPSSAISYGVSFLTALAAKYIELPHGSGLEKVVLGSSDGAIEVEVVGLDKIRNNLARLERLRQVSLDNELVCTADPPGQIRRTCTGMSATDAHLSHLIHDTVRLPFASLAVDVLSLHLPAEKWVT